MQSQARQPQQVYRQETFEPGSQALQYGSQARPLKVESKERSGVSNEPTGDLDMAITKIDSDIISAEGMTKARPDGVNINAIRESGGNLDGIKLSPTPRKSERTRKDISYDKLNTKGADSDEEDLDKDVSGRSKRKANHAETVRKMTELFDTMKKHPHADLFNQALNTAHPLYLEIKDNFTTLSMLDLHFKIGDRYKNTDDLASEFRSMIMTKMKMSM